MYDKIASEIMKVVEILKGLNYNSENISPREFYEYMTGETPTGDIITLEDVLCNEFLMVHEVVEISELKKMNVPINKQTIVKFYPQVYEAHFTALNYELTYALNKKDYEWLKRRIENFQSQLDDPYLPPEFNHLKQKLTPKYESMIEKFSRFISST
ncbi:MAG: hypothetical protein ACPL0C_00995 [Candidatus Bathyarchaeales archaeon]